MSQHTPHAMYATPNHDELSRESFVRDLMTHVTRDHREAAVSGGR